MMPCWGQGRHSMPLAPSLSVGTHMLRAHFFGGAQSLEVMVKRRGLSRATLAARIMERVLSPSPCEDITFVSSIVWASGLLVRRIGFGPALAKARIRISDPDALFCYCSCTDPRNTILEPSIPQLGSKIIASRTETIALECYRVQG